MTNRTDSVEWHRRTEKGGGDREDIEEEVRTRKWWSGDEEMDYSRCSGVAALSGAERRGAAIMHLMYSINCILLEEELSCCSELCEQRENETSRANANARTSHTESHADY